jgi:hypothetical protein
LGRVIAVPKKWRWPAGATGRIVKSSLAIVPARTGPSAWAADWEHYNPAVGGNNGSPPVDATLAKMAEKCR